MSKQRERKPRQKNAEKERPFFENFFTRFFSYRKRATFFFVAPKKNRKGAT